MGLFSFLFGPKNRKPALLLQPLECRIVLDASVDADPQQHTDQNQDADSTATLGSAGSGDPAGSTEPMADSLHQVYGDDLNAVLGASLSGDSGNGSDDSADIGAAGVRVLVINSLVADHEDLAAAAQDGVVTIVYDGANDTPSTIISLIETALDGRKADSIAFAAHDLGEARFHLAGSNTVSLGSLLGSLEMQSFWQDVGGLLTEDGRIDLLACNLASTDTGQLLVSQLEQITGHNVAASDDATGDAAAGGDWILETDGVDAASIYLAQSYGGLFQGEPFTEYKVTASDAAELATFGNAVAICGDYAVVGAENATVRSLSEAGAAYVFHWDGANWVQTQVLTAVDGLSGDHFGESVAIDGNVLVVGASQADKGVALNTGAAYVFELAGGIWGQTAKIKASDRADGDEFGWSVDIDGSYAIVGARFDDTDAVTDHGSDYIFEESGGTWSQADKLLASDGDTGTEPRL